MALNSKIQVELPKKGIIIARTGKYPYVFHVTDVYRDINGHPSNKRKSIGKLDKATGKLIPNNTYYEFYGDQHDVIASEMLGDIHEVGITFLTNRLFSHLGINDMLESTFGIDRAESLRLIVSYMLSEGNVMNYLEEFCERSLCKQPISDKSASRIFANISNCERFNFFRLWAGKVIQKEYLVYDVTSFSSYAEGINDTEWGYNRDGERLPQINMGLYIGQTSLLPVFYVTYPGSIVDKSHLSSMMSYNTELCINDVCFVMDKGFVSATNLEYMHNKNHSYIVPVENRFKTVRQALNEHKKEVRSSKHRMERLDLFGMSVRGRFYGVTSNLHIYYAPDREAAQISDMYRKIASEKEELAQMSEATPGQLKKYKKHYIIKRDNNGNFTYELDHKAIDALTESLGYFCILTNNSLASEEVISIYRNKDVIEKVFCELKNHIEMKRLRTHSQDTTEGKMFCAFLTLILRKHIENLLSDWMKKNKFTFERLIRELSKVRSISFSDKRSLVNPLNKKQKEIFAILETETRDIELFIQSKKIKI